MTRHPTPNTRHPAVLAIDPGRAKCGVAVVSRDRVALERAIVSTELLPEYVRDIVERYRPAMIVVGGGTGSAPILAALESVRGDIPLAAVDESHTSEMARVRYMADNPPRGLRRLLPSFLRSPEQPYDDYVALILAERWIESAGGDR